MEVLHNTLEIIDNMEISEGNRLIICNELKKLSNAKELMEPKPKPIKEKVIRNKDF
jgi:hypothetical protein